MNLTLMPAADIVCRRHRAQNAWPSPLSQEQDTDWFWILQVQELAPVVLTDVRPSDHFAYMSVVSIVTLHEHDTPPAVLVHVAVLLHFRTSQ